jgi:two-component system, sensor histidine kinase PdtaS
MSRKECRDIYGLINIAIPLGFIVNELVTNTAKYAQGDITVQIGGTPLTGYSLSVLDAGPGLPAGFDPAACKSLGMKIVLALAKQIGGMLQFYRAIGARELSSQSYFECHL